MPKQRLGAYAVVLRLADGREQMLLTRVSPVGFPPGAWGLPGGGVEHGESPADGMRREVREETSLVVRGERLIDVHDFYDAEADYHGVHLLYAADVDTEALVQVLDIGGTTDRVEWRALTDLPTPLLPVVEHVLDHMGDYRVTHSNT